MGQVWSVVVVAPADEAVHDVVHAYREEWVCEVVDPFFGDVL